MIRAAAISALDQALLSGLNFALAVLLIHFASKQDYGLYSQLVNLQSFFSPFHAGIFVSAYLSLAFKMDKIRQIVYRSAMAQAEIVMTISSAILVVAICWVGSKFFKVDLTFNVSLAFGAALLGLWWREFVRQTRFVDQRYDHVLKIDAIYCAATSIAVAILFTKSNLTTGAVFWCMAFGAMVSAAIPLVSLVRGIPVVGANIRRDVSLSWKVGRWEVLGSFVTWGYAQSYVYFAAVHGGLDEAAEISAGRLLGMPLALLWASYSNVLRPNASRLLVDGSYAEARKLAWRSVLLVLGLSLAYALFIFALIPLIEPSLFGGRFPTLRLFSMWWTAYFTLTGVSTVAVSFLRSALQFQRIFHRQVINCVVAVAILTVSMYFSAAESLVVAMSVVEAISAVLFWRSANIAISQYRASA